jgi:hypothetical protein
MLLAREFTYQLVSVQSIKLSRLLNAGLKNLHIWLLAHSKSQGLTEKF